MSHLCLDPSLTPNFPTGTDKVLPETHKALPLPSLLFSHLFTLWPQRVVPIGPLALFVPWPPAIRWNLFLEQLGKHIYLSLSGEI